MFYKICSTIPITVLSSFCEHRLEESLTEKDLLLATERQEIEVTKKLLSEAQGKNEELLTKIEDAEKSIAHYHDATQRSIVIFTIPYFYTLGQFVSDLFSSHPNSVY